MAEQGAIELMAEAWRAPSLEVISRLIVTVLLLVQCSHMMLANNTTLKTLIIHDLGSLSLKTSP